METPIATILDSQIAHQVRARFEMTSETGSPLDWTAPILAMLAERAETPEAWADGVLTLAYLLLERDVSDHFVYEEARQIIHQGVGLPANSTRSDSLQRRRAAYQAIWSRLAGAVAERVTVENRR